jgi:hypothetical protein
MWFVSGITALAVLGGPRGVIENHLEPIGTELGGWLGLALSASGWRQDPLPEFGISIEPQVFRAATLLDRDATTVSAESPERWWFPGRFQADGVSYAVDLQFVGSRSDTPQLRSQAWRVRFRGKDRYHGMRELELAPADAQRHATELVLRDRATEIGLLAPPAGFATLQLNGAEGSTVFWSEDNSPAMLDRLGYPKGEILTPGSAGAIPAGLIGRSGGFTSFSHYVPSVDRDGRWSVAEEKLERMLALTLSGSDAEFLAQIPELLDIDKFLTWNSLLWIFADPDRDTEIELSWYFDPVTGLFEPVIRDYAQASADSASRSVLTGTHAARIASRLLAAPAHRTRRNEILWNLVGRDGDDLVTSSDAVLGSALTGLAKTPGSLVHLGALRESAEFRRTTRSSLKQKVAALRTALAASQVETIPLLSMDGDTPTLTLTLEPAGLATIELDEIRFELGKASISNHDAAEVRTIAPSGESRQRESVEPIVIGSSVALRPTAVTLESVTADGRAQSRRAWTVEMRLPFFSPETWAHPESIQSIDVVYRNTITGEPLPPARLLTAEALASKPGGDFHAMFRSVEDLIAASNLPLEVHGEDLVLPAGDHVLAQTLVVPRSHRLRLDPGVTLRLGPDVSVISFRSISVEGTATHPIRVLAQDAEQPWGVIAVTRASEISRLSFVTVSGGSRSSFQGIEFDGQLSFNASDVLVIDSEIYGSRNADGLSVKRANFEVSRTQFVGNESDGIDAEWSEGVVHESLFVDNGDDGIDLADSEVSIDDCAFHWMGDKSISAGERSRVSVAATRLSDSEIAIASKEDSRVDVRDSEFRRNRLGFSLYRSKPVFGGGSGSVTGGVFARNERDFAVEPGSNLELNRVHREADPTQDELIGALALRPVVTRSR